MTQASQAVRKVQADSDSNALRQDSGESLSSMRLALPRLGEYIGIFLIAAAVLLFELALTRVFAVILWAHLAFMVVSTALFGFGLSGVYLALRPKSVIGRKPNLSFLSLCVAATILLAYFVVVNIPFQMWNFAGDPRNYLRLAIWYGALVIPFFFAGLVIAELLTSYPRRSARLYGVDLVGAACGCLLLIPVLPLLGGQGAVLFASMIAALAALMLARNDQVQLRRLCALAFIALAAALPWAEDLLPLEYHQNKRRFNVAVDRGALQATRWSPLSKVDIAEHRRDVLDIWIDGGTNESAIFAWNGDLERLTPQSWHSSAAVYDLRRGTDPNVLVIGPSGGKEVLFALSHGAAHIDAVELDPSIVHFVSSSPYKEFMGGLYQNERVNLVNDEGRAYLRRKPDETYDIIQFVNNYTPVAIAAGALNLSETFLITQESFIDFWNKLKPGGVLALHRGATLRVALTAFSALRQLGIEDPQNYVIITSGEVPFFEGFFLKKGKWTEEEQMRIHEYMKVRPRVGGKTFLWTPFDPERDNLYSRILSAPEETQKTYFTSLGINLFPATDDQPFIEHFLQFGKRDLAPEIPREFVHRNNEKWRGIIPRGDFPYVAILVESAVLGLIFVGLPLVLRARHSVRAPGFLGFLAYFAALGFAFIVIEICLMKRYVLFLGNPAYSITTILVAVLLGAGIGSIVSEKIGAVNPKRALSFVIPIIGLLLLAETVLAPLLFQQFLGLPFAGRVAVAIAMLLPLGFVMGMPFPLGLKLISDKYQDEVTRTQLTAWAWGMNGYFTVIGSASTVFIALFAGFKAVLICGIVVYLLGLLAIRKAVEA